MFFRPKRVILTTSSGLPKSSWDPLLPLRARWWTSGGPIRAPSMGYLQHMTQYPFSCLDTSF